MAINQPDLVGLSSNYLCFKVLNGEIVNQQMLQFQSRGDSCLEILKMLIFIDPPFFEGMSGFVSFDDNPPARKISGNFDLRFCTTKRLGTSSQFLRFPSFSSYAWPEIGIESSEVLLKELLERNSPPVSSKMFWIGANTHPSRLKLRELGAGYPLLLEINLMGWRQTGARQLKSTGRYISLPDHAHYKYLIDCEGRGYSGRLKWLLATGRPVFVVERRVVEHWHEDLIPWTHYIPVRRDFGDLLDSMRQLDENRKLYRKIGENARDFVRKHILIHSQLSRIHREMKDGWNLECSCV